jgi:hypothetical protein
VKFTTQKLNGFPDRDNLSVALKELRSIFFKVINMLLLKKLKIFGR